MVSLCGAAGVVSAADCENPKPITFSMVPTGDTAKELAIYQPLIKQLEETTGKRVDFYSPTSYASVMEALISGGVDVAVLGPASYTQAKAMNDNILVFATYSRHAGHMQEEGPGYRANLISRAGSGIKTVEDTKGKSIGFGRPGEHFRPSAA